MKPWRLTPRAQDSLIDIALWTLDTFGPVQAELYEEELVARCTAVAEGRASTQECALLLDDGAATGLRFTRAGEHFAVFLETEAEVIFVDFLHARTDLPARIANNWPLNPLDASTLYGGAEKGLTDYPFFEANDAEMACEAAE